MTEYDDLESFDTFLAIVARLRGPGGCPWDREQTHASLRKYLLEECYEALEAIDAGPGATARLAEELGDVLLQVGLHAQIGSDDGQFSIRDVLRNINAKLLRRHPHVFGDAQASHPAEVEAIWQKLKQSEGHDQESVLEGVPKSMPALAASQEIQGRAARMGFDWPDMGGVLDKVREELDEFRQARSPEELEHELGDILAALVNVGRKLNIDSEGALRKGNERFRQRFGHMEQAARRQGRGLEELPLDEQESLWQQAKSELGGGPPA